MLNINIKNNNFSFKIETSNELINKSFDFIKRFFSQPDNTAVLNESSLAQSTGTGEPINPPSPTLPDDED